MSGKETVKCGYLTKSPPDNRSAFHGWKKRYFILIDSQRAFPFAPRHIRIEYYQNYEDSKLGNPLGMIELNNCSGVLKREQMKSHKHVFDIVTPTRVFHLSADSTEEREEWVELLNTNIFLFNQLPPLQNKKQQYESYRRSSDFSTEPGITDLSVLASPTKSNGFSRDGPRAHSMRLPKSTSVMPTSPVPQPDMFFPTTSQPGAPNSYSDNLKIIASKEPEATYSNSYCDNEIISEKGFTAIPEEGFTAIPSQEQTVNRMLSSLPVTNECSYINVGYTSASKPTDTSSNYPAHPAPYKKMPVSMSMQAMPLNEDIESEYSCLDPLSMAPISGQYAKVQKHK